ncbi:unnamed protein product [Lampetra fluviatilis]
MLPLLLLFLPGTWLLFEQSDASRGVHARTLMFWSIAALCGTVGGRKQCQLAWRVEKRERGEETGVGKVVGDVDGRAARPPLDERSGSEEGRSDGARVAAMSQSSARGDSNPQECALHGVVDSSLASGGFVAGSVLTERGVLTWRHVTRATVPTSRARPGDVNDVRASVTTIPALSRAPLGITNKHDEPGNPGNPSPRRFCGARDLFWPRLRPSASESDGGDVKIEVREA